MRDFLSLAGAVILGVGVGLHYLPAGVAVFGAILYLDSLVVTLLERSSRGPPVARPRNAGEARRKSE